MGVSKDGENGGEQHDRIRAQPDRSNGAWRWAFEIKTVNAKGLDLRLRMPAPFDRVEAEARARLGKALHRGTCFAAWPPSARARRRRRASTGRR